MYQLKNLIGKTIKAIEDIQNGPICFQFTDNTIVCIDIPNNPRPPSPRLNHPGLEVYEVILNKD